MARLPTAQDWPNVQVLDKAGAVAVGSGPAMTLQEIERWIGDHIKSLGRS